MAKLSNLLLKFVRRNTLAGPIAELEAKWQAQNFILLKLSEDIEKLQSDVEVLFRAHEDLNNHANRGVSEPQMEMKDFLKASGVRTNLFDGEER